MSPIRSEKANMHSGSWMNGKHKYLARERVNVILIKSLNSFISTNALIPASTPKGFIERGKL